MQFDPTSRRSLIEQLDELQLSPGESVEFVINGFQKWALPIVKAWGIQNRHPVTPILISE